MALLDLNLSVAHLPQDTLTALVYELTNANALGRDWRLLADYLGFNALHIRLLEQHPEPAKAWLLFEAWERTGRNSIKNLIIALMQLRLRSSLDVLRASPVLRGWCCILVCMIVFLSLVNGAVFVSSAGTMAARVLCISRYPYSPSNNNTIYTQK